MQKIMVCIKRVVDYNVRVRVKPDGSGVMLDGVKMSVNPFDEIALEEALRIKERVGNVEVLAVSIGVTDTQQQLRTALAMGSGPRDPGSKRCRSRALDRGPDVSRGREKGKS
jgi:electron transfer flavoprotein beta subunit